MPGDRVSELYHGRVFNDAAQQACRNRIHWMCGQVVGDRVLDLGCSQGIASILLGREGHHVIGVDIDPEAIQYATAELEKEPDSVRQNVEFRLVAPERLPFDDNSFDTVLLTEVIEHQTRPEKLLSEVRRLLRPDGRVIITTPFGVHPDPGHVRTFYLGGFCDTLAPFFDTLDLRIVDKYTYFIGVKSSSDASRAPSPPDARQLLTLSETAFLAREEEHWGMRHTLVQQSKDVKQDLVRVRSELEASQKQAAQVAARLAEAERRLALWDAASTASLERMKELLHRGDDGLNLSALSERTNRVAGKMQDTPSAGIALEYLPELILEVIQAAEGRVKQLVAEYEAKRAQCELSGREQISSLKAEHEAEVAKQRESYADRLRELRQEHQQEVDRLQRQRREDMGAQQESYENRLGELQRRHEEELSSHRTASEDRLQELQRRHEEELSSHRTAHEDCLRELHRRHQDELLALRRSHEELFQKQKTDWMADRAGAAEELTALKKEQNRLRGELQRVSRLYDNAEANSRYWKSRSSSLIEYYKAEQQVRLEEVRYRLGDAFVRAWGHPKDMLLLPGRFIKLLFIGIRRRRERRALGIPDEPATAWARPVASLMPSAPPPAAATPPMSAPPLTPPPAATTPSPTAAAPIGTAVSASPTAPSAGAETVSQAPAKPAVTPPSKSPAAEVFERVPYAPHIGTSSDPRETTFARPPAASRVRVAAILDEFSRDSFAPEFDMVTFRPDNWASVLKVTGADLLLVESAWHGNDGAWQYRIASYPKNMGNELSELVECCKRNGVPTVFWNKEDPVHFDRFIDRARHFDVILTTDADCIPMYREQVKHDRVYALPFAAQPRIHNPIQTEARLARSCFAGAYYATRFEQRRDDMDCLLRPAMEFGLDIFDRMHDAVGPLKEQFQFPAEFQSAIRGRLDYRDMVSAYRRYRVFLNVNSVKNSPTMFSRRVFELLACGTPVVSTYSKGIEQLLGQNGVYIVQNEQDARRCIESLMNDDDRWARAAAMGIRKVLSEHTYADRFAAIRQWAGLPSASSPRPFVAVVIPVEPKTDLTALAGQLSRQTYPNIEIHLFARTALPKQARKRLMSAVAGRPVFCWDLADGTGDALQKFLETTSAQLICSMETGAMYGPDYLDEAVMFFRISEVDVLGRKCHYRWAGNGTIDLVAAEAENRMTDSAPSATICARKTSLSPDDLRRILTEPLYHHTAGRIFSPYRYGFLAMPSGVQTVTDTRWCLNGQGSTRND